MPANQASEPKRWLKKREFLAYYMVYRRLGTRASLGEVLDVLSTMFTRRVARNILKRLRRVGLVAPVDRDGTTLAIRDLHEYLDSLLARYLEERRKRMAHSSSS